MHMPDNTLLNEECHSFITACIITLQAYEEPKPKEHRPPSHFNLVLAMASCLLCPFLGWLAIIFAAQVRPCFQLMYNNTHFPLHPLIHTHTHTHTHAPTHIPQAKYEYNKGNYNESDALCTRSRGTALYSIAIGIGLGLGYGVLVGAGLNLGWYG